MAINRRDFLKISASNAALVMAISLPTALSAKNNTGARSRSKYDTWNVYITIHPNNQIEIASPVQDMGQHMKTAGPMLIAEELDADWSLVSCVAAGTFLAKDPKDNKVSYAHASMDTGGSHALRNNWDYLRQAGATANYMLKQAAAKTWNCDIKDIITNNSVLHRQSTGQKLTFGEVASIASSLPPPTELLSLKKRSDYSIIGNDTTTVDIDQIITGKPLYALDMDYPGQLHVVVARCPYYQGKIKSYDDLKALKVNGVLSTLRIEPSMRGSQKLLSAGVAVVATSLWSAMKAKKLLQIEWDRGPWSNESSQQLKQRYHDLCWGDTDGKIARDDGNIKKGFSEAEQTLEQEYFTPFFHHSCMEPFSCIADITADKAPIIVGHQSPEGVAKMVADFAGLDPLQVDVQAHRMGGGFGRKWTHDFVTEAAILSKQLKAPVKVTWTREDEAEQDYFGPMQVTKIKAGIDANKGILAWHYRHASKRGSGYDRCFPANLIDNYRVETFNEDCGTPVGAWRGPGHLQYTFASESMMDELAYSAKTDPFEFRQALYQGHKTYPYNQYGGETIDAERMLRCYEKVVELSGWKQQGRGKGIGLGIAGHFTFGSYTAFVVEVDATQAPNYRVIKCWGAIDCGLAVNPNHIRNQMEGGFIDGLNAAMFNQAEVENGRVVTANFDRLPMLRMSQAPIDVEVAIMENSHPPTGVGEPPTAPAAAALANALFAATGQRIRHLPIKLEA
jgi:isoquinoline 1-oxidoreductase beta subunit